MCVRVKRENDVHMCKEERGGERDRDAGRRLGQQGGAQSIGAPNTPSRHWPRLLAAFAPRARSSFRHKS